jgi:DNA invertase Pin-like site-specific DNA recombinase
MLLASPRRGGMSGWTAWLPNVAWRAAIPRVFRRCSQRTCRLLNWGRRCNVLIVTPHDRLARSTRDLLNTLASITDRKAGFRSLGDAWADTTTAHWRLRVIVLGGLAEFERDIIHARTSEVRAHAKARG